MSDTARTLLIRLFEAAVASAQPARILGHYLPPRPTGRLLVIGAGKASATMARVVEVHYQSLGTPVQGLVVTRYGHNEPCHQVEVIEAAHPVPDTAGLDAATRMLAMVQGLSADDLVLVLLSGGGSALLTSPLDGIELIDKQHLTQALLASGASISEMNCVRRHLSNIKGGRLAAACYPAQVVNLMISDVAGDNPINIASGPTVGDPTTCQDALAILQHYGIKLPPAIGLLLESGVGESVKPGDSRLAKVYTKLIATPQMALLAAEQVAATQGVKAQILSDRIEGEAKDVAKVMAAIATYTAAFQDPWKTPLVLISGGETTVSYDASPVLRGKKAVKGGRNVEFLLSLAIALEGHPGIHAIACDTDGIDGNADVAGAYIEPHTLRRAKALGMDPRDYLQRHDAHTFFAALGDQIVTGPTKTNVNDFRAIWIHP